MAVGQLTRDDRFYFMNGLQPFFELSGSEKPIASISWILPPLILWMCAASRSKG